MKRFLCTEFETKRGSAQSMPFQRAISLANKVVKSILGRGGTPLFERSVLRLVRMRGNVGTLYSACIVFPWVRFLSLSLGLVENGCYLTPFTLITEGILPF